MSTDISIIIATCRPKSLYQVLSQVRRQSINGVNYQLVIVQESDTGFAEFDIGFDILARDTVVLRSSRSNDFGATAKDLGLRAATGEYCVFWDDDNIYFDHALSSQFSLTSGVDLGISRVLHGSNIIPVNSDITPGDIDTMCICLRTDLAKLESWKCGGRLSDYRYIKKILKHDPVTRRSSIIIGRHI